MTLDTLFAQILRGQALSRAFIFNCHAHIGRNFNLPRATHDIEALIRTMDACGIDVASVSSSRAIGPDVAGGNDAVIEAARKHPERVVGAAVVNPRYAEDAEAELHRVFAAPNIAMIKVHPESHSYAIDGPGYEVVWRFAAQRSIPVLIHTWGEGRGYDHPSLLSEVASSYPSIPLILAHAGGTESGVTAAVAVARDHSNIYLDTATSLVYRGAVEYMYREVGPSRILFGTDATYLSDAPQLAKVVSAIASEGDLVKVLGENLRALVLGTGLRPAALL